MEVRAKVTVICFMSISYIYGMNCDLWEVKSEKFISYSGNENSERAILKNLEHIPRKQRSIIQSRIKIETSEGKSIVHEGEDTPSKEIRKIDTLYCYTCKLHFKFDAGYKKHCAQQHKGMSPYHCYVCGRYYKVKCSLLQHFVKEHPEAETPHKRKRQGIGRCPLCDVDFGCRKKLEEHASKEHPGEKTVICEHCDEKFLKFKLLDRHKARAHDFKNLYCNYCKKFMATSEDAAIHKEKCEKEFMEIRRGDTMGDAETLEFNRWNYNSELPTYCKICDQHFKFHCHYKRHHVQNHPEIKLLACKHCGKHMSSQGCLKKHVSKFHQDVENAEGLPPKVIRKLIFKCEYCPEEIVGVTNYEKHGRDKHANQDLFHCSHCVKGFNKYSRMILHLKNVHGMGGALCKFCGNRYARTMELRNHEKKCEDERNTKRINIEGYFCGICQRMMYMKKKSFRNHVTTCAEYEKCSMCEQRFHKSNRRQMEHHMNIRHTARMNIDALLGTLDEYNSSVKKDEGDFVRTTFQPSSIVKEEISNE